MKKINPILIKELQAYSVPALQQLFNIAVTKQRKDAILHVLKMKSHRYARKVVVIR